jgi:excisionase family DNA binding protein
MGNAEKSAPACGCNEICSKEVQRLADPRELSARLGVPLSWVYMKTRAREIPFVKVGHYCRFDFQEVVDHLRRTGGK